MFKPIQNPFIVGNPIKSPKMFYGRQDDFQYIKTKLEDGKKSYIIVLCGERRSGKTSILFQILSGRLGENFVPILIDMQTMAGLKNELEFFEKFAQEATKSLKDKVDTADLFKTTTDSSYKAFSGFLDVLHEKYKGKHIVFLIDEYEIIESKIEEGSLSNNFIPFLAGMLESDKPISFIFTGSSQIDQRKGNVWQVLFGKSLFRNVSFLSKSDTERLIREPVDGVINYDIEVINQIFKLTYGQPFYTQVVCQNIVDYVNQKQRDNIQLEDLEIIVGEILENPLPQMIYFWNSLQADKKLVLSLLAEVLENGDQRITAQQIIKEIKKKKFGLNLTVKDISTTLEALFHTNYVSKSPQGFSFQMDLFRRWVKRDHAIWRVMKEVATVNNPSAIPSSGFESQYTSESAIDKSRKIIIPVLSTVIVMMVLTWWFLLRDKGSTGEPAQSTNISEPLSVENNSAGTEAALSNEPKPEREKLKDEQKEAEVPVKREVTSTPQKTVSKPSNSVNSVQKTEELLEGKALSAQDLMLQSKQEAVLAGADKNALKKFTEAQKSENEGVRNLSSKNFSTAKNNFETAAELFIAAINEGNSTLAKLAGEATDQQAQMQKVKQKLDSQHQTLPAYQSGRKEELEADNLFSESKYEEAVRHYRKAEDEYSAALREYEEQKKEISNVINGYLAGIQNESIAQMKKYHSNFGSNLENDWSSLFEYAENINVKWTFNDIEINGTNASSKVDVNLEFKGADKTSALNRWKFSLQKQASSWIISNVNDGK